MAFKHAWNITKQTVEEIFTNRVFKLSAALAYYTIFSLPGLLIVIIWIGDSFFADALLSHSSHADVQNSLYKQIEGFIGTTYASQIWQTINNAAHFPNKALAKIIGVLTLIFGATGVFAEIQDSINMIWRLKARPKKGKGWLKLLLDRLMSFSVVVSLGFLLLVSLLVNGLMELLTSQLTRIIPESQRVLAYVSNLAITFLITSILFGMIFKVLPDAKIKWRAVRAGAIVTALLFMGGKFLISYYLGHNKMSSAYGAAGSVIVILLWVYYSAIILYIGAVFTRVYAIHHNMHIYPSQYAVWVEHVEVENKDSIQNLHNDPVVAKTAEEHRLENIYIDTPGDKEEDR
ncbi:YihY/virulence factor BrkB family protein [Niabella beijingensis]|uniref:YihY/virulence factor BrkB family protein n=1 Tax=Niabella beijingensis TaxID=2872700 RepID=UPI001CBF9C06|nr:YihY/virulence factor BrkB family protein [Niabella beijingensis]MBZ4188486.1 YihY/virulence factor BrkB family protein [Niabella beijingensis]